MTLIEISFTPYIPTTLLGLLGLISGYLFFYFKNKNDNKLKKIQSVNSKDRVRAIEMSLNELGIRIDTSNLDSGQKFLLIRNILRTKTNRYLITSITSIILAALVTFLIWSNYKNEAKERINNTDSTANFVTDSSERDKITPSFKDSVNVQAPIIKDIQDSLDMLPSLTTEARISKTREELRNKLDSSSTFTLTCVAVTARARFQYTDGKTYFEFSGFNDLKDNYYYHWEIELADKNWNTIRLFKSPQYEVKGTDRRNWIDIKDMFSEVIDKSERIKVKYITAKGFFNN